jgi:hypothetical protein
MVLLVKSVSASMLALELMQAKLDVEVASVMMLAMITIMVPEMVQSRHPRSGRTVAMATLRVRTFMMIL